MLHAVGQIAGHEMIFALAEGPACKRRVAGGGAQGPGFAGLKGLGRIREEKFRNGHGFTLGKRVGFLHHSVFEFMIFQVFFKATPHKTLIFKPTNQ